jgi:exo-beta-1,3-glucanase (GH17 family)
MVPNTTYIAPSPVPETSTSCIEDEKTKTPIYVAPSPAPETSTSCTEEEKTKTPIVISTPAAAPSPSKPAEVYPPAPPKPETSKPAESYPAPPPKPETSKPAEVYPVPPPKPEHSAPAYPTKPAPAPSSSKAADKPKPTGGYSAGDRIVTNGNKWAMTYTPYAKDGQCKTADEIKTDIKNISEMGFTTIRSYSTDCGVFESVVPECQKYGLKVIYGIFLEGGGSGGKGPFSTYANEQLDAIKSNAPKDSVAMVIVGNECIFNGNCDAPTLGSYIDHVRQTLQGAGFPSDIAITTTEPVGTWEEHGAALCDHIDIFTCQVHPYFTQTVTAEKAGEFAIQQLAQAAKVCPEAAKKGTYITEIGWPSAGNSNGAAVASPENQKIAIHKIQEAVGDEACIFSYQNDPWKDAGDLNVEQYFGCAEALI